MKESCFFSQEFQAPSPRLFHMKRGCPLGNGLYSFARTFACATKMEKSKRFGSGTHRKDLKGIGHYQPYFHLRCRFMPSMMMKRHWNEFPKRENLPNHFN